MRGAGPGACIAVLVLGALCRAQDRAPGVERPFWAMPSHAAAYWAVGPGPLPTDASADPARALVESALRGLVLHTFDGPSRRAPGLAKLLTSGILARQPYRAFLLNIHAPESADSGPRTPIPEIDSLAAILELRDCTHQDEAIQLLTPSPAGAGSPERTRTLPQGVLHTLSGDAGPGEVAWLSTGRDLIIGFGKDAIGAYFAAETDTAARAAAYRDAIEHARPAGERFFEAFVNLDALRVGCPDEMGWGRCARLMDAWGVANARGLMLTGRTAAPAGPGPRLMLLDFAHDDRSQPFGNIRWRPISDDRVPPTLSIDPRAGYAIVLNPDWNDLLPTALGTFEALAPETPAQAQRRRSWLRAHQDSLGHLAANLGHAVVQGPPGKPALLNLTVSTRSVAGLTGDLRATLGSLSPTITFDSSAQYWQLRLLPAEQDPDHAMKGFTFALTPTGIVGSWDPTPVRDAASPRRQP